MCGLAAQAKQLKKFQIQDKETFPHCLDKFCHSYPIFNWSMMDSWSYNFFIPSHTFFCVCVCVELSINLRVDCQNSIPPFLFPLVILGSSSQASKQYYMHRGIKFVSSEPHFVLFSSWGIFLQLVFHFDPAPQKYKGQISTHKDSNR